MNGDSIMKTWPCHFPGCPCKSDGIGTPMGLLAIGWDVEKKEDGDYFLFCPDHHRVGQETAQAVALAFRGAMIKELKAI